MNKDHKCMVCQTNLVFDDAELADYSPMFHILVCKSCEGMLKAMGTTDEESSVQD